MIKTASVEYVGKIEYLDKMPYTKIRPYTYLESTLIDFVNQDKPVCKITLPKLTNKQIYSRTNVYNRAIKRLKLPVSAVTYKSDIYFIKLDPDRDINDGAELL